MAHVNEARADTQEQNSVALVLSVELGRDHVHGCFAGSVQRPSGKVVVVHPLRVGHAAGDADDLFGAAFEDLWDE